MSRQLVQKERLQRFVLERFMHGKKPSQIVYEVSKAFSGLKISRPTVHNLVRSAASNPKFLLLVPPRHFELTKQMNQMFIDGCPEDVMSSNEDLKNTCNDQSYIRVVEVPYELPVNTNHEQPDEQSSAWSLAAKRVGDAGADLVIDLIRTVAKDKKGEIHIGVGVGRTVSRMMKRLATLVQADGALPRLVMHALSPLFGLFEKDPMPPSLIRKMHASSVHWYETPLVRASEYAQIRTKPWGKQATENRNKIDIIVSSLASSDDEHGYLYQFMKMFNIESLDYLQKRNWAGDLHFRGYSPEAPIEMSDNMLKPVTLFDLSELVGFAAQERKYSVLLCGPCVSCRKPKTRALLPLLQNKSLRTWNHLVMDEITCKDVLRILPQREARRRSYPMRVPGSSGWQG